MTLRDLLEAAARDADVAASTAADDSTVWSAGGRDVVVLDPTGATVSFRLDPVLAGAARRTPDVSASPRGPEWVAFRPMTLDEHALDRAEAWFAAAVRRAGSA